MNINSCFVAVLHLFALVYNGGFCQNIIGNDEI